MATEPIEVDAETALARRVDAIIAEWDPPNGTRGSKAEVHAASRMQAARAAVRELLEQREAELARAVEAAVSEARLEVGGLNEVLTEANGALIEDVERKDALLTRLGMSHQVATQVAIQLGFSITTVVIVPGGGTVGAGSVSYDVGDGVVVVYNAGIEPTVEIANSDRTSVVIYSVTEAGLTSPQLDAIGTLFRTPTTVDQPASEPEEVTRRMPPSCTE